MKNIQRLTLALLGTLSISSMSCTSGPNAQTGTVLGALGGAGLGGIIGHQSGRGLEGAAIGAGLGALGGNLLGGAQDQRNYYNSGGYYGGQGNGYYRSYGPPPPPPRGGYYY